MEDSLLKKENFKKRQSNFELLKIICMILIIAHHFSLYSSLPENISKFNFYFHRSLAIFGKISVNIFVLISGYFMINSKFSFKKVFKLLLQTFFYCFTIYSCFCIFGLETFNVITLIKEIFCIFFKKYWFIGYYIILYILSPFLNKLLKQCSIKEFAILLTTLLILQLNIFGIQSKINVSDLAWFITLYITSAFIRLYLDDKTNMIYAWTVFCCSLSIIFIYSVFFEINCYGLTNIFSYAFSVSTFYIFKHIKIKTSSFINLISSTTLGTYLIHENNYIRAYLWNNWLNVPYHATINNFWLFCICAIILVFTICTILDLIRILIDKLFTKILTHRCQKSPQKPPENKLTT